jgi:membrane protease YdiL (CAAX protease family)
MIQRPILTFCILSLGLSWLAQAIFLFRHESLYSSPVWSALIMWIPGMVGTALALIRKMSLKEMGFTLPRLKETFGYYLIPVIGAVFIFLGLIVFQISHAEIRPEVLVKYGSVSAVFLKAFVTTPVVGFFVGTFYALGEEIGWRGFLLPFVVEKFPTRWPWFMGLIWAVYHWPLILFGDYATSPHRFLSLALFSLMILYSGTVISESRLRTRSVLPAAIIHGSHNLWWQGIYPAFIVAGPLDAYFGGESGVFGIIFYALVSWIVFKRNPFTLKLKRHPVPGTVPDTDLRFL